MMSDLTMPSACLSMCALRSAQLDLFMKSGGYAATGPLYTALASKWAWMSEPAADMHHTIWFDCRISCFT